MDAGFDDLASTDPPGSGAGGRGKRMAASRPVVLTAAVAVVVVVAAVTGWLAHWPGSIFGVTPKPLTWTAAQAPLPADATVGPGGGIESDIAGVACPSAGTCVAAGGYLNGESHYGGLIETASGGRWVPLQTDWAPYGYPVLDTVACLAPGRCMAGGHSTLTDPRALVDTRADGMWTPSSLPLPPAAGEEKYAQLAGLACPRAGSCVAVGSNWLMTSGPGMPSRAMIQTLSNGAWTAAEAPLPADAAAGASQNALLDGVACTAPGSCVAVGSYIDSDGAVAALIETLANGTWTPSVAPPPAGTTTGTAKVGPFLTFVACTAPGSCMAVGGGADPGSSQPLVETLANGTWTPSVAPLPKGASRRYGGVLDGVACSAPGTCVVVGSYYTGSSKDGISQGLIETLAGGAWSAAKAPLPGDAAGPGQQTAAIEAVACATTQSCVATGNYTDRGGTTVALLEMARPAG